MKVVLFNAVSLDGFIADASGNTEWVRDLDEWEATVKDFGCMIIGRKTHDEVGIIEGAVSFVYTRQPQNFKAISNAIYVGGEPADVIKQVREAGFDKVLLVGGAETSGAFAQAGLIDEIILDIHPITLGKGFRLLGGYAKPLKLELRSSHKNPKSFVQNRYKVLSN